MTPELLALGILALDLSDDPAPAAGPVACYCLAPRPDGRTGEARYHGGAWRVHVRLPAVGRDGLPTLIGHTFNVGRNDTDAIGALEWAADWVMPETRDEALSDLYDV